MKIEENLRLNKLFDCYGNLLSNIQKDVLTDFLYYNLTSSEIAENHNVSRQAVKDALVKGEKKLEEIEEKLKLMARIESLEKRLQNLEEKGKK